MDTTWTWLASNAHLERGLVGKIMNHKGVECTPNSNLHSQGPLFVLQTQLCPKRPDGLSVETASCCCLLHPLQEVAELCSRTVPWHEGCDRVPCRHTALVAADVLLQRHMFGCTGGLAAQLASECHPFRDRTTQRWGSSETSLRQDCTGFDTPKTWYMLGGEACHGMAWGPMIQAPRMTQTEACGDVPSSGHPTGATE